MNDNACISKKEINMEKYIGTKIVEAEPAMRKAPTVHPLVDAGYEDGYKVVYADGYESWSPKAAFEEAYHRVSDGMTFGEAITALKQGHRCRRRGWNGKGIFIELQRPDEHSKMTEPYIFIDTNGLQTANPDAPISRVPWLASQTDMLREDWEVVE